MRYESGRHGEEPQTRHSHEILREATQLLRHMTFWSNRGAYAEGRYVAISVDPRWNEDNATLQVALTCYAFGHQQVDWQGLPIYARPAGTGSAYGMTRLDARGQGIMTSLHPDDYRLYVPEHYGRSEASLPLRSGHTSDTLAAATDAVSDAFEPQIYDSLGGSVTATVHRTPEGTTIVAFETADPTLRDAVVYFAFVQESGDMLHTAAVELTPVEEEPGLSEARWEGEVEFTANCTFEFGVFPGET